MTIEELQKKLDHWRKNKTNHRDRIPKEYWEAAARLASSSSPSTVASKLNLNVWDLKKRMGISTKTEKKVVFKELPVQKAERKPIFELTTASGITLKVYQ